MTSDITAVFASFPRVHFQRRQFRLKDFSEVGVLGRLNFPPRQ